MYQEDVYVDCLLLCVGEHIDCSSGGEYEKVAGHSPYASVLEKKQEERSMDVTLRVVLKRVKNKGEFSGNPGGVRLLGM